MVPIATVYVSSTWIDLQSERAAVEKVLARIRETKFLGMEHFGSRPENTERASVEAIEHASLYIGILGARFGSGITRQEYEAAKRKGIDCLVYLKSEEVCAAEVWNETPEQVENLSAFKAKVRQDVLLGSTFGSSDALAASVATDVHRWLFERFLEPQLQRAAAGQMPLEDVQTLVRDVREPSALRYELKRRLRGVIPEHVTGLSPVVIHVSAYPALTDYRYDFSALIDQTTSGFVGRLEILEAVRAFQARHSCGYFRVLADAGLGKTALAAEVAGRYDAPAFFCSAQAGLARPEQCLRHLCAELIIRFELPHDHLPGRAGTDSEFLKELLIEATEKIKAPLWIVVDGLDEADDSAKGGNPLWLPAKLPARVFCFATHRPLPRAWVSDGTPQEQFVLLKEAALQQRDVRAFVDAQLRRPELQRRLQHRDPRSLAEHLTQASEGNFKYLEYVFQDLVEARDDEAFSFTAFPQGLVGYYEQFWARMELSDPESRGWAEWNGLLRPVASLLAVAAEPVTADWLATHGALDVDEVTHRVLRRWRRFLEHPAGHGERWRVVHKSFADFLETKAELKLGARHRSVAEYYRASPERWNLHDGYARRHLTSHLRRGGDLKGILSLVDSPTWYEGQLAADPAGSLFLNDVQQAWLLAADANRAAIAAGRAAPELNCELQCALTSATLRSLSSNLPPNLLLALVRDKTWTARQALAAIRQNPSDDRNLTLRALAPALSDRDIVLEALAIAREATTLDWPAPLVPLLRQLAKLGHADDALREARAEAEREWMCIAQLLEHLDAGPGARARERLFEIVESMARPQAGRRGARREIVPGGTPVVRALIAIVRNVSGDEILSTLARARGLKLELAEIHEVQAVGAERLVALGRWSDAEKEMAGLDALQCLQVISAADASMAGSAREQLVARALRLWRRCVDVSGAAAAHVLRIADGLQPARRHRIQRLVVARIGDFALRSGLAAIAPWLDRENVDETVRKVCKDVERGDRTDSLVALAKQLFELNTEAREIVEVVQCAGDSYETSTALAQLAAYAAGKGKEEFALAWVARINRSELKPNVLVGIAPALSVQGIARVLEMLAEVGDDSDRRRVRFALANQLAHLGRVPEARQQVDQIGDGEAIEKLLRAVAVELGRAGEPTEGWKLALTLSAAWVRVEVASALASHADQAVLESMAVQLIELLNLPGANVMVEYALANILPRWAQHDLRRARAAVRSIRERESRLWLTCSVYGQAAERERERIQAAALRVLLPSSWSVEYKLPRLLPSMGVRACCAALEALPAMKFNAFKSAALRLCVLKRLVDLEHNEIASQRLELLDEASRVELLVYMAKSATGEEASRLRAQAIEQTTALATVPMLAPCLDEPGVRDFLEQVRQFEPGGERVGALAALIAQLALLSGAEIALSEEAESCAREERTTVLVGIVARTDLTTAQSLMNFAFDPTLPSGDAERNFVTTLAQHLARLGAHADVLELATRRRSMASEIVTRCAPHFDLETLERAEHVDTYPSDELLAALAKQYCELGEFERAYGLLVRSWDPDAKRLQTLVELARNRSPRLHYTLLARALRDCSAETRPRCLAMLQAFAPILAQLGGARALRELAELVTTLTQRWS